MDFNKYNFSRNVILGYNLSNKHPFKKRAGNATGYYELKFDETLENDLKVLCCCAYLPRQSDPLHQVRAPRGKSYLPDFRLASRINIKFQSYKIICPLYPNL